MSVTETSVAHRGVSYSQTNIVAGVLMTNEVPGEFTRNAFLFLRGGNLWIFLKR